MQKSAFKEMWYKESLKVVKKKMWKFFASSRSSSVDKKYNNNDITKAISNIVWG